MNIKTIRKSSIFKFTAVFFIFFFLMLSPDPVNSAVTNSNPANAGFNNNSNIVLQICVVVIMGIIVGIGGCTAKKILDKLPPTNPPPPPPPPPPSTNAPPVRTNRTAITMASVSTVDSQDGAQSWNISSNTHVTGNTQAYSDPVGSLYHHIYTMSVQRKVGNGSWITVGSRMMWMSDQSATVIYFNGQGNGVHTNHVPRAYWGEASGTPQGNVYASCELQDYEVTNAPPGVLVQFRLASKTNAIGIITSP